MKKKVADKMASIAEELELTSHQKSLFKKSAEAKKVYLKAKLADVKKYGKSAAKQEVPTLRDVHRAFTSEVKAENPKFGKVASSMKKQYQGKHKAAFNDMVDTMEDFHKSLSEKQRKKMNRMMEQSKNKRKGSKGKKK
jgi:hypothetical protein